MTEERYLKITSCYKCPYYGYTNSRSKAGFTTFFCSNPENMKRIQVPATVIENIIYPITYEGDVSMEIPIPKWCKLPNIAYYQEKIQWSK